MTFVFFTRNTKGHIKVFSCFPSRNPCQIWPGYQLLNAISKHILSVFNSLKTKLCQKCYKKCDCHLHLSNCTCAMHSFIMFTWFLATLNSGEFSDHLPNHSLCKSKCDNGFLLQHDIGKHLPMMICLYTDTPLKFSMVRNWWLNSLPIWHKLPNEPAGYINLPWRTKLVIVVNCHRG